MENRGASRERGSDADATLSEHHLIGRRLDGRYDVQGTLGAGGVGVVYRAEDRRLGRKVAVKVLNQQYVAKAPLRLRFEREAKALAALAHPNIVAVTDYGVDEGLPFLVMELLEGQTLKERLEAVGPLDEDEARSVARQILLALAFAHDQGLVHRDLKPGNVFLRPLEDGQVHVSILDFGLAKFVTGDEKRDGPSLTATGMIFGTPAYMSPEQCAGQRVAAASDLYTVGVVLFEMLSGRLPFQGDTNELLRQHLLSTPPLLSDACADRRPTAELDQLVAKALEKSSSERFAAATEMLAALDALPTPMFGDQDEVPTEACERPTRREGLAPSREPTPEEATSLGTQPTLVATDAVPTVSPAPAGPAFTEQATVAAGEGLDSAASPEQRRPVAAVAHSKPSRVGVVVTLVVVLAGLAGALVGAIALATSWLTREEPPASQEAPAPTWGRDAISPGATAAAAPPAPSAATGDVPSLGRGPLESSPLPPLLETARAQLARGETLDRATEKQLRSLALRERDDPRPLLLLARNKVARGSLTDAVDRYERAFAASPSARDDPRMLPDLVRIAGSTATRRATRALVRIYGAAALPAIDRALSEPGLDATRAERLRRAREQIARGG